MSIRASLWFIPGIMIAASIILAHLLIHLDSTADRDLYEQFPSIFSMGADGSRGMLTAIASSMLTVAGLCFTLTLSTISGAAAQYTPRILRNFMSDRTNQFILGYFVSVFAYCLVVLRTIRGADEFKFVPSLGVLMGLILAIGGILVLIYFIHHIATSLEVTNIIHNIEAETARVTDRMFKEKLEPESPDDSPIRHDEVLKPILETTPHWYPVRSKSSGYIHYVDADDLAKYAAENDMILRMQYGVGQFIGEGSTLMLTSKRPEEGQYDELLTYFNIFRYRTIEEDVGYGIRQIVDIALKALPGGGSNDTTTAISCIDYLGLILARLAGRKLTAPYCAVDGEVRILIIAPTFTDYINTAFDQIRINGKANLAIMQRLMKTLNTLSEHIVTNEQLEALKDQMQRTRSFAHQTLLTDHEKQEFEAYYAEFADIKLYPH